MKALVGAFNQEKALVGAFSVIVKTDYGTDGSFYSTNFNAAVLIKIVATVITHHSLPPNIVSYPSVILVLTPGPVPGDSGDHV